MRPKSIVTFERVVLVMLVLGIASAALSWEEMGIYLRRQGLGEGVLWISQAISIGVTLLLLWLIAHRRSVIAKWFWVVLSVLGLVAILFTVGEILDQPALTLLLEIAQYVLLIVSIWLLFRPDTRGWFANERPHDETFG